MKIFLTLFSLLGIYSNSFSQTNTFPSEGNVGIGTINPENSEGWAKVLQVKGTTDAKLLVSSNQINTGLWSHSSGFYGAAPGGFTGTSTNHPFSIITNSSSKMTIATNGNVGIGNSDPQYKLDVAGEIRSFHIGIGQLSLNSSVRNYVNLGSDNHASLLLSSNLYLSGDNTLKIAKTNPTLSGTAIYMPGDLQPNQGSILFYTKRPGVVTGDAEFTDSAAMVITGDRNIGIGTKSPKERLSVNGKIRAHEIKVETANWPDYVFDDNYNLTTLQELKKYIDINHHLPDMPAAVEVEKEGVALGEMNKLLLKKIEELTLHLIQKDKEISKLNTLNQKVEDLERKIDLILKSKTN